MATKPTVPDLKELFKQAAEIAKQVPESMQEAAFNRAVDLLTHGVKSEESAPPKNQKTRKRAPSRKPKNSHGELTEPPLAG